MTKNKLQKGFTLIELLVVVAIIMILASTILASLGSARQKARVSRGLSELSSMRAAQELYYSTNGAYDASFSDSPSGIANLVRSLVALDPAAHGVVDSQTGASEWAYYVTTGGQIYCADSNGYSGKVAAESGTQCTPASNNGNNNGNGGGLQNNLTPVIN